MLKKLQYYLNFDYRHECEKKQLTGRFEFVKADLLVNFFTSKKPKLECQALIDKKPRNFQVYKYIG